MLDERAALKLRLEQMKDAEERLVRELQRERAYIYDRLRALDRGETLNTEASDEEIHFLEAVDTYLEAPNESQDESCPENIISRRARPSRRSKTTKMRDTAIRILKEQSAPIRGVDLKRVIEEQTGFQIANMTTFMNTISKADANIIKIGRGLYTYHKEPGESETIYIGLNDNNGLAGKEH